MKKILVADDSVTIQKVIALTFADEPFEVQSVGTGAEALEMMNTWKPDVLLADVIMPQMNGYELCRAVKEQQETSSIPVLLLAGTFEAFDEEEAKSVGADGYITKPFESVELIEKVNGLVGKKPEVEPAPEPQVEVSQEETSEEEPLPMEPVQEEPPQVEPPEMELPQVESPQIEPLQIDSMETPFEGIPEPDRTSQAAPGPVGAAAKSDEPDIWDILSDTGGGAEAHENGFADAAVPGMGPIEDQGVVDVGSFDVGLDRPEQATTMSEPPVQPDEEMPSVTIEHEDVQPVPEKPVEPPVSTGAAVFPTEQPEPFTAEKSRVEDREKDFFGFETEGPEAAGEDDFLGDAVEEITFEMEELAGASGDTKQEASFIVPEPAENEIAVTGETLSPEVLAPEHPTQEEPPSPEFPVSLDEQVFEPVTEEDELPAEDSPPVLAEEPMPPEAPFVSVEKDIAQMPERTEIESVPETEAAEPEPVFEPKISDDLMMDQAPETAPFDASQEPTETEIRQIIEEKVEKIVWEVVPEMAEVLIREAIEKIKGKP